jgi:hypothetical protein
LAEDLRERLAALERAEERLADGTYSLSIESGPGSSRRWVTALNP